MRKTRASEENWKKVFVERKIRRQIYKNKDEHKGRKSRREEKDK